LIRAKKDRGILKRLVANELHEESNGETGLNNKSKYKDLLFESVFFVTLYELRIHTNIRMKI